MIYLDYQYDPHYFHHAVVTHTHTHCMYVQPTNYLIIKGTGVNCVCLTHQSLPVQLFLEESCLLSLI